MLIDRSRQKMIHAIIYFAENTRQCGKTKLHKLLYLLDFEHFQKTGRSVTGLDYFAWKMGPVPVALQNELDNPEDDFRESIGLACEQVIDLPRLKFEPKCEFDSDLFSQRELKLMHSIAKQYKNQTANEMVEVTHGENHAWAKIWQDGEGNNERIPYEVALSGDEDAFHRITDLAAEHREIRANYA